MYYMHFYDYQPVTRPLTENTVENITSSDVPNITAIYDDEYIEVIDNNDNENDTITDDEYYYFYNQGMYKNRVKNNRKLF